jgi:hypothetical protein
VSSPKYNEIWTIINKLKSNKAAGPDNIPSELIKNRGSTSKQKISKFILKIWNKELPTQWNEGIICPIYKERERLKCNDHRPITLLNTAYNVFTILLNRKISDILEKMEKNVK